MQIRLTIVIGLLVAPTMHCATAAVTGTAFIDFSLEQSKVDSITHIATTTTPSADSWLTVASVKAKVDGATGPKDSSPTCDYAEGTVFSTKAVTQTTPQPTAEAFVPVTRPTCGVHSMVSAHGGTSTTGLPILHPNLSAIPYTVLQAQAFTCDQCIPGWGNGGGGTPPGGGGPGGGGCGPETAVSSALTEVFHRSAITGNGGTLDLDALGLSSPVRAGCTPSAVGGLCLTWPEVEVAGVSSLAQASRASQDLRTHGLVGDDEFVLYAKEIAHPHHALRAGHAPDEILVPSTLELPRVHSELFSEAGIATLTFNVDGLPYRPDDHLSYFGKDADRAGVWVTSLDGKMPSPTIARVLSQDARLRWNIEKRHEWLVVVAYSLTQTASGSRLSFNLASDIAPFCGPAECN